MKLIARVLITALALLLVAKLVPGVEVEGLYAAVIAALILGLLNVFMKPLLVFLTLPITLLSLGLFIFVINGFLFWFTASFLEGFSVSGIGVAILASLLVTVISTVGNRFID